MKRGTIPSELAQNGRIPDAVFFCRIADPDLLHTLEFYAHDLHMLGDLADRVTVCTTWRELRRAPRGLLWAWWPATALPAVLYWRLRRRPVVLTGAVDLSNPLESGRKKVIKRWLTWLSTRLATLTLTISEYERGDLAALAPSARIATLHPGVDCEYFTPGAISAAPSVVTVAQINPQSIHRKGVDRVVDAFRQVHVQIPGATLTVIGPISPEGQEWIDHQRAAGLLDDVEFAGRVDRDRKRVLLASAWVYVQPSRYEGFGLALAEAMSCGARPVTTDVGSLPEVVGDVGAVLHEPTIDTLAAAITAALRHPPSESERATSVAAATRFDVSTRDDRFRAICRSTADRRQ